MDENTKNIKQKKIQTAQTRLNRIDVITMENGKAAALRLRKKRKSKEPEFLRQNWFRFPSLGRKWRAPIGKRNKLRKHIKGKGYLPKAGYGSPLAAKGLHPSGLAEARVFNESDLQKMDPKTDCARIASCVGGKKRIAITKKARQMKIRVLNPGVAEEKK